MDCINYFGKRIHNVIAFEPDSDNFTHLKRLANNNCGITAFQAGVWSKTTTLEFNSGNLGGSRVDGVDDMPENVNCKIQVRAIDETPECSEVNFIKMTVEGSELAALEGAKHTIMKNRPILTISIYHTNESMLSIPEWMANNLLDYKFYCRHHSYYIGNTILYAIPIDDITV